MNLYTVIMAGLLAGLPGVRTATAQHNPASAPAADNGQRKAGRSLPNAFFAMDTATKGDNRTYEEQVRMIKELGYAGWGPSRTEDVPQKLAAVDKYGLRMFALYTGVNLDPDQPKYDPALKDVITSLKKRDAILWVFIRSKKYQPSSAEGNERAVSILREIADMAEPAGVRVALYPHFGLYVSKVGEAVSLADKIDRKNVGVTFNLCHWLRGEKGDNQEKTLKRALPRLFVVTINGADRQTDDWGRLIQPLGQGDYDMCSFLKTLNKLGYKGPIGFQGYGIKGDMHQVLADTMSAWKNYAANCH